MSATDPSITILALPKGRISEELAPLLNGAGIVPEPDFFDDSSRKLKFSTNIERLEIIRVRAFDVATFVAYGAADFGVVGSDVLEEFEYDEIFSPLDLRIGQCRLSVAAPANALQAIGPGASHIRVATKYPNLASRHFARRGVQAECIKLNGAMEIAPALGLASYIVDLVSTGSTLKANGLMEIEMILSVSSRLIINRSALKTRPTAMKDWIARFEAALAQNTNVHAHAAL